VVSTVLKGDTFYGRAFVVNQWYLTAYEPIKDDSVKILGILYVGVALEKQLAGLKKDLANYAIGKTGYIYVLDSKGQYVISKNNERNGENLWDAKDSNGRYIIREIVATAKSGREGQIDLVRYPWQNKGEMTPREKVTAVSYFQPLDWVIGTSAYESELNEVAKDIKIFIAGMLQWVLAATVLILIMGGLAFYVISRRIVNPKLMIARQAQMFARGEIEVDENDRRSASGILNRKDELGQIGRVFEQLKEYLLHKTREANQIAQGVLALDINMASEEDALGQLFQQMTDSLNTALVSVKGTASQVASGSGQISSSSQNLSDGTGRQVASIEEITASMKQLSDLSRKNADTATEANHIMTEARNAAEGGTARMEELITATAEMNESSKEIAKIIKAIDDIAFQTNLLALNAAVEAARAGRHGKGFAVVAQEVRNLAGRSAKAAQETAELIDGSVKNIENGNELVHQTAEALGKIVDGITKVTGIVEEITSASNEQAEGIAQINQGLSQVENVTNQNAANAEETAAAAEELSAMASQLRQLVSRFKLNGQSMETIDPQGIDDGYTPRRLTQNHFERDE